MADNPTNIAASDSRPSSEQSQHNGSASNTDTGVRDTGAGFIDPDTARATGTGTAEPAELRTPGKRGRHKSDCQCANCSAKRAGGGTSPGPSDAKQEKASSLNLGGLEKILFSIHAMGAVFLKTPELALEEIEAKKLAKAIEAVNAEYKIAMNPKTAAWIDLGTVAATIYGPRCVALYFRSVVTKNNIRQQHAQQNGINDTIPRPGPTTAPVDFNLGAVINDKPN